MADERGFRDDFLIIQPLPIDLVMTIEGHRKILNSQVDHIMEVMGSLA
jgi:hypothetical protein